MSQPAHFPGISQAVEVLELLNSGSGVLRLADLLGVSRQNVEYWLKVGHVPAKHAPDIEQSTGIRCEVLCPGVNWAVLRRRPKNKAKA